MYSLFRMNKMYVEEVHHLILASKEAHILILE